MKSDVPVELSDRDRSPFGSSWQLALGFAILGVSVLVAIRAMASRLAVTPLTFEWDEWTILTGMRSGFTWLFQEHVGNFFPLGRAVYWAETVVFGFDYRGYVWVNFSLLLATSCVLMMVFVRLIRSVPLAACLAALYLVSHGQYVNVTWALQVVWFVESLFTAILLLRVVDIRLPVMSAANVTLIVLAWLSFGSAAVAIPFLVFVARMLARRASNTRISTSDVLAMAACLVMTFVLVFVGRTVMTHFPSPHPGGNAPPITFHERFAHLPEIAGDALYSYGFFATAPLVPGALSTLLERVWWEPPFQWSLRHPVVLWLTLAGMLTLVGVACWRTFRMGSRPSSWTLWGAMSAVCVGMPVALTALARVELFGSARSPRYDTFLVLSSLLAVTAFLIPSSGPPADRRATETSARRKSWLRCAVAAVIVIQLGWLLLYFPWNIDQVTAWRVQRTVAWRALAARCASSTAQSGPFVIPAELQSQLTVGQFCAIVARLGNKP